MGDEERSKAVSSAALVFQHQNCSIKYRDSKEERILPFVDIEISTRRSKAAI